MILDQIAKASRSRVEKAKQECSLEALRAMVYDNEAVRSFHTREAFAMEKALTKDISFLCEVKKASPSKGTIVEDFPYLEIAKEYEGAGADAISVLTEPEFFQGDIRYLTEISRTVSIPVLRKDFIIDEYQIYEAKLAGADAVLLICSLLNTETLREFIKLCDKLGLSALVEAHTEQEIASALKADARMVGVNNRNLQTFTVDLGNSIRLRNLVPEGVLFVAESGIRTAKDIMKLKEAGVNAVLIGETLMRSPEKGELLKALRGN